VKAGPRFARRLSPVHVLALTTLLALTLAALFGIAALTPSPGYAANPPPTCAPLAPPPVPGSPVPAPATPGIVLLNEILTDPGSTWNCAEPSGTYSILSDSWVELYNPQSQPLDLYAVHAYLDNGPDSFRFYLPFGAAIAPGGFLVVFPNSSSNSLLQANSNLRLVFGATGAVIDQVNVTGLAVNYSYARIPDGSPNWKITGTPTIDSSNIETSATPTPTASSSSSGSGTGTTGSSGSGTGIGGDSTQTTGTSVLATGTQPAWNRLTLPASTPVALDASPTTAAVATPTTSTPAAPGDSSDVPHRILLTVLLVLLAGSLFWCWKIFSG
jgi:hypothetical protein